MYLELSLPEPLDQFTKAIPQKLGIVLEMRTPVDTMDGQVLHQGNIGRYLHAQAGLPVRLVHAEHDHSRNVLGPAQTCGCFRQIAIVHGKFT